MWAVDLVGGIPGALQVSSWPSQFFNDGVRVQKKALKFVLYYVIGAYVNHDELEVDNIVVFGSEASVSLARVHVNREVALRVTPRQAPFG